MPSDSALFPRNFRKSYPLAVKGEGCWIIDKAGRRFLDASGQAAVVNIGHGVAEIGDAMAERSSRLAFAHTTQFHSEPAEKLAQRLLALAPPNFRPGGRVYFTSGGSEATETAIKLARQLHLERGQPARYRVVSRRQSYHGSTLGAMTVSGNVTRRAPYQPQPPPAQPPPARAVDATRSTGCQGRSPPPPWRRATATCLGSMFPDAASGRNGWYVMKFSGLTSTSSCPRAAGDVQATVLPQGLANACGTMMR